MVNCNGLLFEKSDLGADNRSFLYGDGIFETFKIRNNQVLFFEDHYFRLMASLRIVRIEIPMNFTMDYLERQVLSTAQANQCAAAGRVRLTVYRNNGGFYLPTSNEVGFVIQAEPLPSPDYIFSDSSYEVDLYRDFHVPKHLLSTLKTTSKMLHVVGSIFARENGLHNCLLLNEEKNVVEALNGNLFMLTGKSLVTPPISDGCLNGVLRKNLLALCREMSDIVVEEASISPFDLQKANEIFITNVTRGIQSISKYRKKEFESAFANQLIDKLNRKIAGS